MAANWLEFGEVMRMDITRIIQTTSRTFIPFQREGPAIVFSIKALFGLILVIAYVYMLINSMEVPEHLTELITLVLGYLFGSEYSK